jgi:hypothetical protein
MTMASEKSTTKTNESLPLSASESFDVEAVNGELIAALRTLAAAGVLQEVEDGHAYRIPAWVPFPTKADWAMIHWPTGKRIEN